MTRSFRNRTWLLALAVLVIFGLMAARLFDMQWTNGEEYYRQSVSSSRRSIRVTGARGSILDASGIPLAYDEKSYTVQFAKDPTRNSAKDADGNPGGDLKIYTDSIARAIAILKEEGSTVATTGYLQLEEGQIVFVWGSNVSESVAQSRETAWRKTMGVKKITQADGSTRLATAPEACAQLRAKYFIPETMGDGEALEILSVWQSVNTTAYTSYLPITLAENVSLTCVARLESESLALDGVEIAESTVRIYPKNQLAAHILGYLGRMSTEETIVSMEAQGYSRTDLVGVSGMEKTMEAELTGSIGTRTGQTVVEVNSQGKVIRTFAEESTQPVDGNNVLLTLDSRLQKVVEEALAENIALTHQAQTKVYEKNQAAYDAKVAARGGKEIELAASGSAVVMDVKTGRVLAMASLPNYDANIFTGGLSDEEYDLLFNDAMTPLLNRTIASRGAPGSIFKMATGLAGLMEGVITPETIISCQGEFREHITSATGKGPKCWTSNPASHANQDIVAALKNSCTYFFGKVSYGLGIEKLNAWSSDLGLNSLTQVELPGELSGQLASQETLFDVNQDPTGTSMLVYQKIFALLKETCVELGYSYDDAKIDAATLDIMKMVEYAGNQEYGADVRAVLRSQLKIDTATIAQKAMTGQITGWLNDIIWNANQTVLAGIGQSVTLLTPIGVARYLSAIVNGGNVYNASLVDSVVAPDGSIVSSRISQLVRTLDVPQDYLELIKEGMREVVSEEDGGTASSFFKGFEYNGQFGGKTGTGQVSTIDLENNSWFVAFAPFDEPEIAIVVYIPHGYAGGRSYLAIKQIVQYYMDGKNAETPAAKIPAGGELTP